MLREVHLKFRRAGNWLTDASAKYPHVTFVLSNLYEVGPDVHASIIVLGAAGKDVNELKRRWQSHEEVRSVDGPHEDPRGARFQILYDRQHSAYPVVVRHHAFDFRFSVVLNGFAYISIVAESTDVEATLRDLGEMGEVSILSIKPLSGPKEDPAPAERPLLAKLPPQQLGALVLAFDKGYYSWPRKVTTRALAGAMGLTTSAYLHHLRRAEDRLLKEAVDDLRAHDEQRLETARATARQARSLKSR